MTSKILLILGASASFAVSLLHLGAIVVGPAAYRLLGAGEDFAAWAESGSHIPGLITFGLAGLFAIFGCYALAGAGALGRLPWLAPVLLGIAALYTLRGGLLFLELLLALTSQAPVHGLNLLYSSVSLVVGLLHFAGIRTNWQFIWGAASEGLRKGREGDDT